MPIKSKIHELTFIYYMLIMLIFKRRKVDWGIAQPNNISFLSRNKNEINHRIDIISFLQ